MNLNKTLCDLIFDFVMCHRAWRRKCACILYLLLSLQYLYLVLCLHLEKVDTLSLTVHRIVNPSRKQQGRYIVPFNSYLAMTFCANLDLFKSVTT